MAIAILLAWMSQKKCSFYHEGFMSRIKILLLILIIAALSIVFIQNREPIALKLFCADSSQNCFYRTPPLPLAVWIALATLTGAIANLLVQSLNLYGYSDDRRKRAIAENDLYPNSNTAWNHNDRQSKYSEAESSRDYFPEQISEAKSFEVKQEPQNVEKSGSTYSYKYRESGDRPKSVQDSTTKKSVEPPADFNRNTNHESNDEDWI
ncbi:MAG: hypothetical protein RLZZ69_3738 [Cyanobacteriota bacterium]